MQKAVNLAIKVAICVLGGIVCFLGGWIIRGVKAKREVKGANTEVPREKMLETTK